MSLVAVVDPFHTSPGLTVSRLVDSDLQRDFTLRQAVGELFQRVSQKTETIKMSPISLGKNYKNVHWRNLAVVRIKWTLNVEKFL